jgi:hypothetical protein
MTKQAPVTGFTPSERDYIRRGLDMFFSTGTVGLAVFAGMQPRHWAQRDWHWRPPSDAPGARPRFRVVGDPRKSSTQFDGDRKLAMLIEDGTDRGGGFLGNDKHEGRHGGRASSNYAGRVAAIVSGPMSTLLRKSTRMRFMQPPARGVCGR